jgi:RHS repeat-associated protein
MKSKADYQSGKDTLYDWNVQNELIKITTQNADGSIMDVIEYAYGPTGNRIYKKRNGVIFERYVYNGNHIVQAFGDAGSRSFVHTDRVDEPLAMINNGVKYFFHQDNLGSVVAITNQNREVIERYTYSAFGEMKIFDNTGIEISESSIGNIFGFTGREIDSESELYYYRARYYSPRSGRFISSDPIGFAAGDTNLYRYVSNNPIINKDPSGKSKILLYLGYTIGLYAIYLQEQENEAKERNQSFMIDGTPAENSVGEVYDSYQSRGGDREFVDEGGNLYFGRNCAPQPSTFFMTCGQKREVKCQSIGIGI